jgi:uncharacterized protein YdeI (YjbR/CyaY-like superfamily)
MNEMGSVDLNYSPADAQEGQALVELVLPLRLQQILQANVQAWQRFAKLPAVDRRRYIDWILSAKREATQLRRAEKTARLMEGPRWG